MNTAPFYKNTTFKVSKMWKMLLPHAWGEKKKKGEIKKNLNISWLYFTTLELRFQNIIFYSTPSKSIVCTHNLTSTTSMFSGYLP